jgi:hypothetical protein
MIRLGKETQLCEWGEGTTTLNQIWTPMGVGALRAQAKKKMGVTVISVEVEGQVQKKNEKDNNVKVMQKGESMTPISEKWGEVAMGTLKGIRQEGAKSIVEIEINGAIKIGGGGPG